MFRHPFKMWKIHHTDHLIISSAGKRWISAASSIPTQAAALPHAATTPHSPTERLAIFTADNSIDWAVTQESISPPQK